MTDAPDGLPSLAERPMPQDWLSSRLMTVQPDWIDYNGHMNVGYYGLAFDKALDTIYAEWIGFDEAYVEREHMGPFALQQSIHFLQEMREGQRFQTRLLLLDGDHKRMHYFCEMWALPGEDDAAEGEAERGYLAATMEQLSMNVSHETRRSAPYPDYVLARVEALLAAHSALPRPEQAGATIGLRRR